MTHEVRQYERCHLNLSGGVIWTYKCLETQFCCQSGCCGNLFNKFSQFGYVWFIVTILAAILLGCLHFLKKQHERNFYARNFSSRRQDRNLQAYMHAEFTAGFNRDHFERICPFRRIPSMPRVHEHLLNLNFSQSAAAANSNDVSCIDNNNSPPSYDLVLAIKTIEEMREEEPPPVYLEACKLIDYNGNADEQGMVDQDTPESLCENHESLNSLSLGTNSEN